VLPGEGQEGFHVGRQPVQVHGQYGDHASLGPGAGATAGEIFGHPIRIQAESSGVDVREDRPGPGVRDGRCRGHEGEGRGEHEISGADAAGTKCQMQGIRSRGEADGSRHPEERRQLLLQRPDIGPQDEPPALQNLPDRVVNCLPSPLVLRLQIQNGNRHDYVPFPPCRSDSNCADSVPEIETGARGSAAPVRTVFWAQKYLQKSILVKGKWLGTILEGQTGQGRAARKCLTSASAKAGIV